MARVMTNTVTGIQPKGVRNQLKVLWMKWPIPNQMFVMVLAVKPERRCEYSGGPLHATALRTAC